MSSKKDRKNNDALPGGLFREMLNLSADAVLLSDFQGGLWFVNTAAAALWGSPVDTLLTRPLSTLIPSLSSKSLAELLPDLEVKTSIQRALGLILEQEIPRPSLADLSLLSTSQEPFLLIQIHGSFSKETDDLFKIITENSRDWISLVNPEREFVYVSPACETISGYHPREFLEDPLLEQSIIHPDDLPIYTRYIQELYETCDHLHEEYRILTRSGEIRWLDHHCIPVYDSQGNWLGRKASHMDITHRKTTQLDLEKKTAQLQTMLKAPFDTIAQIDREGIVLFINPSGAARLGHDVKDLIGKNIYQILPARVAKARRERFLHTFSTGESVSFMDTRNGMILHNNVYPVYGRDGNVVESVVLFVQDVSTTRKVEAAMQEQERRFRDMLENVNLFTNTLDTEGRLTFINDYSLERLGWTREELLGRKWSETCIPENYRETFRKIFEEDPELENIPVHNDNEILTRNGERLLISWNNIVLRDTEGRVTGLAGIGEDITEKWKVQRNLEQALTDVEQAHRLARLGSWRLFIDENRMVWSDNVYNLVGRDPALPPYTNEEWINSVHPDDRHLLERGIREGLRGSHYDVIHRFFPEGSDQPHYFHSEAEKVEPEDGSPAYLLGSVQDITEKQLSEETLKFHLTELEILSRISTQMVVITDEDDLLTVAMGELLNSLYSDFLGVLLYDPASQCLMPHRTFFGLSQSEQTQRLSLQDGVCGWVAANKQPLRSGDTTQIKEYISPITGRNLSICCVPILSEGNLIGVLNTERGGRDAFSEEDERMLTTVASLLGTSITRIRAFQQEQQRRQEAEVLQKVSSSLSNSLNLQDVISAVLENISLVIHFDSVALYLHEKHGFRVVGGRGFKHPEQVINQVIPLNDPLMMSLFEERSPIILEDAQRDKRYRGYGGVSDTRGWMGVPLLEQGLTIGALTFDSRKPYAFTEEDINIARVIAAQTATAIAKARLFSETQRRIKQLQALHDTDQMISSSMDLKFTLGTFLGIVRAQLGVDAADVFISNESSHELILNTFNGFLASSLRHSRHKFGQGLTGRTAVSRDLLRVDDLSRGGPDLEHAADIKMEGFKVYIGIPLVSKGKLKGVLELFHRSPLEVDDDWLDFLHMLSIQAAIAIENMELVDDLQQSNMELSMSYDLTLKGWANTLELRDRETEGHSQRVTQLTVELARMMGISESDLIHVQRGALLHDIGKIGIPDHILSKPGPLTNEEWEIMRMHPVYAYKALADIPFLRNALEIPYSHHERWDGSGYPQGLQGEQIPLAARVFAVVDVYDALTSNRPYRNAWPEKEVILYLKEKAGVEFDPSIVQTFLMLLETKPWFREHSAD